MEAWCRARSAADRARSDVGSDRPAREAEQGTCFVSRRARVGGSGRGRELGRELSASSDSAAECATVDLWWEQNSNAPESQPARLRLRGKQGAAAPLSPCLPMTLAGHVTIRGGDIISVLCVGRETRSCRRAVRQKRMPRYRASQKWPSPAGIVAGERRERLGSAQLVLGANG